MPPIGCGLIEQVQDESGPTSEDPIFVLTASQLQEIIARAIQPLQDRIESLESMVANQGEEIAAMKATVVEQKADYLSLNDLRCDDWANVARQVTSIQKRLEGPGQGIGKTSEKRIAEIDKILRASPNGAVPFKIIKEKLGLAPNQFTRLVSSLDKRKYQVSSHPSRPKGKILRIKARWS